MPSIYGNRPKIVCFVVELMLLIISVDYIIMYVIFFFVFYVVICFHDDIQFKNQFISIIKWNRKKLPLFFYNYSDSGIIEAKLNKICTKNKLKYGNKNLKYATK